MIELLPVRTPTATARRRQIVDAACDCVKRSGFHGASIAEIAKAASLSVGQIYRYFENKDAIIAAIVARDATELRERFAEFEVDGGALPETALSRLSEVIDRNYDPSRAALLLEVLAESARNPGVAAIVRSADATERRLRLRLLAPLQASGHAESELAARSEVLSMLFEGMVSRGVQHPEGDRQAIGEVLNWIVRLLLTEPVPA